MARLDARGTALALAAALIAFPSAAQSPPKTAPPKAPPPKTQAAPGPSAHIQTAMKQAEAGDAAPLVKLADGGDVEAQYYAGVLFLFGSSKIPRDPPRGCAYEHKASARRGDAMHLVGMCYQNGVGGAPDKAKAEAAYKNAMAMGFSKSKCVLGKMLMGEPARAGEGLKLCQEEAKAGDTEAQVTVGDAYFNGAGAKRDHGEARKWYAMAAQKSPQAARRLGEMYSNGDGGRADKKKAMEMWVVADKLGDPLVAILVADHLFSQMTGGKKPGPGTYGFKNAVPVADIEVCQEWYQMAKDRDPRPDVKQRADYALKILASLKAGAAQVSTSTQKKR